MEQIPSYNLLQAIDPTKIKVPISDRFAKLTLSSNKKQQQKCQEPVQQEELQRIQEKRDSVSRNISKQFDDENKENLAQNPLLRSESSKESEKNNTMTMDQEEEHLTMDPLEVSQDNDNPTQLEDDLNLLTQQVASMAVEPNPISLSSGSTCNLSEFTELVSTESHRSSTSDVNNVHIVHHIPINVKEAVDRQTIFLNLPSSTNDNVEKNYEMTEDEDEEDEDEDDEDDEDEDKAITISDTSESHHEQEPDIMATSSLPSTSLTSQNLVLPSQIDDKAERVAAFLRDVSIEQRIIEQGQLVFTDTLDQILDNIEVDKINETLKKSRQIATADTESMTPDVDEEVTHKSIIERKTRLKALDKSIGNEPKIKSCPEIFTENEETSENSSQNAEQLEVEEKNVHRLVNDDTQDNTEITDPDEDSEEEKLPKIASNRKTTLENADLKTPKAIKQDLYRMVNDETLCNTEFPLSNETPKIHSNRKNKNRITENNENFAKVANLQKEENTEHNSSPQKNTQIDPRRLANDETMANSILTDIDDAVTQPSLVYNYSQDYKTPEKINKLTANEETINNSVVSIQTTPESSDDLGKKRHSFSSVINSSTEQNNTVPEHSITILETDDESIESKSPENQNSTDKKLSNSFHREETSDSSEYDEQMERIQMSMGKINISAKINIKIHIPNNSSTETSEDEQNYVGDSKENERASKQFNEYTTEKQSTNNDKDVLTDSDKSIESNEHIVKSELPEKACNQRQLKPAAEVSSSANNSSDSVEIVEDKKFLTEAEKLLTQLYGQSWQTPDVMRTLKRSSQSGDKKSDCTKTSSRKKIDINNIEQKKSNSKNVVEESMLGDFSIFRQNIVKTNLDSTRLGTARTALENKQVFTEPRNNKKPLSQKEKINAKFMPKSERKPVAKVAINKGRVNNTKWRQLIHQDSNSEGDNASDDEDADESWSKNASELELDNSDSDFENSSTPTARGKRLKTKKRQGRSKKSDYLTKILNKTKDGEIVYLDLSKEEVEVQDEVPKSPPANHDVMFASRIEDILKTCRHEDKPKLPSSNKKTKRKLFTPNFGDDDFEAAVQTEDKTKNNVTAGQAIRANEEYEVLEDNGNCPFDSMGRPKVLDLVNKRLESVKTGKPIFELTPSPKKKTTTKNLNSNNKNSKINEDRTSKSKSDNEAIFKTPLTVISKGPTYSLKDVSQTPDYKYSFLKSLDVTVSKTLCHPDALYFRENYCTKKEELSKILYELYNEKLFNDKLNVPIIWNKKLLNTAGRCLNKKRLGLRSSVIELSHKVLTSADRLRCTLIHELCHAATWIFNGEGGHGSTWKEWARKANAALPEIPKIGVCHQYDIEYKYTYKCTLCAAKSHAHSKSKKVENIRCSYCHGAIEIFLNKKDKDGNITPTPVKEPTGFAKFVKDNYKKFKRDDLKHADVMKLLSSEFAALKVAAN